MSLASKTEKADQHSHKEKSKAACVLNLNYRVCTTWKIIPLNAMKMKIANTSFLAWIWNVKFIF